MIQLLSRSPFYPLRSLDVRYIVWDILYDVWYLDSLHWDVLSFLKALKQKLELD